MFAKTNWKYVIDANIRKHNTPKEIVWEANHIKADAEI